MQKKKVLMVAHHLTVGGAQKSMIIALKYIDYEKNDVTLYVRKNRLDLLEEIDKRVKVIINEDSTHYYRKIYSMWLMLWAFVFRILHLKEGAEKLNAKLAEFIRKKMMEYEYRKYFEGETYDVAISYIQGYTADLVAERIIAERKIIFYHSSTDEAHEFHEYILPLYDEIVAVGDNIRTILQKLYPEVQDKISVIYNYVDFQDVRTKAELSIENVSNEKIKLCSCGRLNPVKGFDLAVKAAKILKDKGKEFIWYFVGDGPERSKLESMIRTYGLEDCVTITGMQSNPYPWIKSCDIYVQPSYEEAYGLSIAEAQILCKPVVSTATIGGRVLIQSGVNGLLSDINEKSLAKAVDELIDFKEKRDNICEHLKQVDYSESYKQYKNAWKQLLEG